MYLYYLAEAINPDQLRSVADASRVSVEFLSAELAKFDSYAAPWILRQLKLRRLRLPEDGPRLKDALTGFKASKAHLEVRDINKYESLHSLEDAVEGAQGKTSKRKGYSGADFRALPGVELIVRHGSQSLIRVSDPESLKQLGEGTKWCTRGSYKECMAGDYIDEFGYILIVLDGLVPVIQFTPDFAQIMDRNDNAVDLPSWLDDYYVGHFSDLPIGTRLGYYSNLCSGQGDLGVYVDSPNHTGQSTNHRLSESDLELLKSDVLKSGDPAMVCRYFIACTDKTRWPEIEPIMLKDISYALSYAYYALKNRRWPELEELILGSSNGHAACRYAEYIMRRRWPEAEEILLQNPISAINYCTAFSMQWPEAERALLKKWPDIPDDEKNNLEHLIGVYDHMSGSRLASKLVASDGGYYWDH